MAQQLIVNFIKYNTEVKNLYFNASSKYFKLMVAALTFQSKLNKTKMLKYHNKNSSTQGNHHIV